MKNIALLSTVAATMPRAFASAPAPAAPKAARVDPITTGAATIALPVRATKRGSVSLYPFDTLTAVGMAFGVKNKNAKALSSIISNQNRKHQVPVKDANGNATYKTKEITGADGVVMNVPDTTKPITKAERHYFAFDVTPEYRKANAAAFAKDGAFEGCSTLVFRDE